MIAILCVSMAAWAESLSINQAVDRALKQSSQLRAVRASLDVAVSRRAGATVLRAPEFRLNSNNIGIDPDTMEVRTTAGLRWSPPRPREISLKQELARAREKGVQAEIRAAESRLAAGVRLAFRRSVLAAEKAANARRSLDLRRSLFDTVKRQVEAGLKEAGDADIAELTVADFETEVRRARDVAASERRRLANLIELDPQDVALLPEDSALRSPDSPPETAEASERALRLRAELSSTGSSCEQLALAESIARNQQYPWLSFAQVTRRLTDLPERGSWGFQIGVDLPLFRTAAAADARMAAAERQRCRLEEQALRVRIRQQVEESIAGLRALAGELAEIEKLRTGLAAKAAERARAALEAGRMDRADVLTAEARVISLRDRWLDRRMDYAELQARLEESVGEP